MTTDSLIDTPLASKAVEPTQAETIRRAMSVDNLLNKPTAMDSPYTPSTSEKEETCSSVASPVTAKSETLDIVSEETSENEDVSEAQREFVCLNDEHTRCQTGQYTKDLSRKVISDHFGRNKACTRDIKDWPLFCRKHYQRATYNKAKWQTRKVQLILRQFQIIENQFPGTTYDITLKKSEEARLNQYSRLVASGLTSAAAADNVAPVQSKHYEAPIDVLRELDQWLGRGKSFKEAQDIVDIILQMLEGQECEQVPAIEFLPQLPGKNASPKKTPTKARTTKSPSRVSSKGSVKKTRQKA